MAKANIKAKKVFLIDIMVPLPSVQLMFVLAYFGLGFTLGL